MYSKIIMAEDIENVNDLKNKMVLLIFIIIICLFFNIF